MPPSWEETKQTSMWILLNYRSVIQIKGQNIKNFLQGLITQDIFKLDSRTCLYSLMLNPEGRILYDFFIIERQDAIYLAPLKKDRGDLIKKLNFYKLGRPIEINEMRDWSVCSNPPGTSQSHFSLANAFIDPRPSMGNLFIGNLNELDEVKNDDLSYHHHRIIKGVPEGNFDLVPGKSIPLENRMDELNAIAWDKGCYIGQQLTSRTKYVGEIRKNIFTVRSPNPFPQDHQEIYTQDGVLGGVLRSRAHNIALAQLRIEYITTLPTYYKLKNGQAISLENMITYSAKKREPNN